MIKVTRLNSTSFLVNSDLVETIEETPDTVLTMQSGRKIVVAESAEELVESIIAYRRRIFADVPRNK